MPALEGPGSAVRAAAAAVLATALAAGCSGPASHAHARTFSRTAVATDHVLASEAGAAMLRLGGNAVDAAVAASFTLSVVRPDACGIGGGGFMLIHRPAAGGAPAFSLALDYRETAPAAVGPDFFGQRAALGHEDASSAGGAAVGVPGTVAGLLLALQEHGRLDRATVLGPAIRAAERGFVADADTVASLEVLSERLARRPDLATGPLWTGLLRPGAVRLGDRIVNPQQAAVLRDIAAHGEDAFYRGALAESIVAAAAAHGGVLTLEDLARYRPRRLTPLRATFLGRTVLSMPPPSSGGVAMQQALGLLERRAADLHGTDRGSAARVHLVCEALKHAFADRARFLADPDFAPVPLSLLLDPARLDGMAARIDMERPADPRTCGTPLEAMRDAGTSHVSVLDGDGMAVACTETINLEFGSLVVPEGAGFALNDQMDDFTTMPGRPNAYGLRQSDWNLPEPGKRPLSSMSPTIVLEGDRAVLVAGGAGGPRIITATLQCLLSVLVDGASAAEAVAAPRFHHQWLPDEVLLEEAWPSDGVRPGLRGRGHSVRESDGVGVVQLIWRNGRRIEAASDPRRGGRPAGE
jgi:gamma-glutamyltranspeptidase/glutathione hydrolase